MTPTAESARGLSLGARLFLAFGLVLALAVGGAMLVNVWLVRDIATDEVRSSLASSQSVQRYFRELRARQLELIAELIETHGEARPVEIAERLGVKPPTVTKNISRLKAAGLVRREPYRAIFLTEKGQVLAETCMRRHRIVVAFLQQLGIDEETAERDAEGIEHHVSDKTLEAFESALNHSGPDPGT